MPEPLFSVRDIVVRYHRHVALDGLSIAIQPGEGIALLGATRRFRSCRLRGGYSGTMANA